MSKKQKQDWIQRPEGQEPSGPGARVLEGRSAERLEGAALYVLVLLCGAGLMSLEMVGARVLWNNFGSSVFVWGSIISVFMAALSLGYSLGGLVADKRPSLAWLAGIVGVAGVLVMLLTQLSVRLCNAVDNWDLGPRVGPLVASVALYFVPSVLLGAVSPFAVRLQAKALTSMGNVAGRLYALGTVGSLAGTLLTTFLLIPMMGTTKILYSIGVLLLAVAVLALAARFASRGGPRTAGGAAATILFLSGIFLFGWTLSPLGLPLSLTPPSGVRINAAPASADGSDARVHEKGKGPWQYLVDGREYDSAYHTISVVGRYEPKRAIKALKAAGDGKLPPGVEDNPANIVISPEMAMKHDPLAVLDMRFNNLTESALYANQPGQPPETTYTRILHMGVALKPDARKVMVMGLGGGSVPREFCKIYADLKMEVDAVEVDPLVAQVARDYFFHRDENGVKTHIADGRQFVRRGWGRHKKYDLIILDAYSGGGQIPAHLVTREFLQQCRDRLEPDGVLVSNIISALQGPKSKFFRAEYKTMNTLFPHIYVFPSKRGTPTDIRNLILVAPLGLKDDLTSTDIVEKAEALLAKYPELKKRTANPYVHGGALESFARRHYRMLEADLSGVPLLTDEFAPVETMFYWTTRFRRAF
ncbi:MAG: spermidine synthase [Planctomycetota bacterium]|jgi:spermidine synthase